MQKDGKASTGVVRVSHVNNEKFNLDDIGSLKPFGDGNYRLINPDGKSQAIEETTYKDGTFSSTELSEIDTSLFSEIDYFDIAFEPTITKESIDRYRSYNCLLYTSPSPRD